MDPAAGQDPPVPAAPGDRPAPVIEASTPRLSWAEAHRAIQPALSILLTVWVTRLREWRMDSAI